MFNPTSSVDVSNDFIRLSILSGQKFFNACSSVNSTSGFINISSNKFKNNQEVVYLVSSGNTAIDPLANNISYYVLLANSTGVILSNTFGGNAVILIKGLDESGHSLSLLERHSFANGDLVTYSVDDGNTEIKTTSAINGIKTISIVSPGSYYNSAVNNQLSITGSDGNGAIAVFVSNSSGNITSVQLLNYNKIQEKQWI